MKKLIEKMKAIGFNTKITVYAIGYVTLMDVFYLIACFYTGNVPSDAWYIAHVSFWGVELALNFGVYKERKRLQMSVDGTITTEANDCEV